jgi:hypothetical protein
MIIKNQTHDKVNHETYISIWLEDWEMIERLKDNIIITTYDIDTIHALYENDRLTPSKTNIISTEDRTWPVDIQQPYKTTSIKFLPNNEYQLIFTI